MIKDRKSRPSMVGLRFFFLQPHQQNWLTDGAMEWLWPAAERAQIPIALMASNHLPAVGRIAERHPSLRLLINHFAGVRGATDDAAHANQPALLALAKYPNVAVKATGAPGNSSQPYPYRNIHEYIQHIYGMACLARNGCSGYRHHSHAVLVAAMRDDVHRRTTVARGARSRARHGPRGV